MRGWGHTPVWLHAFVRTFDLPFFMVISGFFCRKSIEKKTWRRVLIDKVTMIFVSIVVWTLIRGHVNILGGMYYFLWVVLASSAICVGAKAIGRNFIANKSIFVEGLLLVISTFALYLVDIPWNLFYLFPFFVIGYYMKDLKFDLPRCMCWTFVLLFIMGECYWSQSFSAWKIRKIRALDWKFDSFALAIYGYRAILAVLGVYVMYPAMMKIKGIFERCRLANVVVGCGAETLALYILQTIVVQRGIQYSCRWVINRFSISLDGWPICVIGYIIAPIVSFVAMYAMFRIVSIIKATPVLRYSFGFKVTGNGTI